MDIGSSLEALIQEWDEDFDKPGQPSRSPGSKYHTCTAQMEHLPENTEHNTNSEESKFIPNDSKNAVVFSI